MRILKDVKKRKSKKKRYSSAGEALRKEAKKDSSLAAVVHCLPAYCKLRRFQMRIKLTCIFSIRYRSRQQI